MAAKKKASAKKTLAKKPAAGMAVYDYGEDAGAGFEGTSQADYAIPFLSVLQTNSPEVEKNNDRFIEGAEAGMLFNTVSKELYDGDEGIVFVPCDRAHQFVEWKPRESGGGFVGVFSPDSDMVELAKKQSVEFGRLKTDEGNDLIETFYMYGLLLRDFEGQGGYEFVMIPFASTKIKVYRQIMYRMRTQAGVPLFANRLQITSVPQKNNKGSFYNFKIEPAGEDVESSLLPPVVDGEPNPIMLAAKEFREQVKSGIARAAYESDANSGEEGDEPF
jgi:hypothetical protein